MIQVRVLAREIVLCSCARHFTVTVPVSIQVYKWVPANLTLGGVKSLHTETGISSGLMGHYWLVCRLFYIYLTALIETSSFLRQQLQKTRRQTNDLMTVLRLPIQEKSWLISSGYSCNVLTYFKKRCKTLSPCLWLKKGCNFLKKSSAQLYKETRLFMSSVFKIVFWWCLPGFCLFALLSGQR